MGKEWMKHLNSEEISLFSLQFANCDRIEKNDAVYMFDEVGSGKTISAGLMAMQCLAQSDAEGSGKNVLIITTPTLSIPAKERRKTQKGMFREDWDGKRKIDGEEKNVGKLTSVIQKMHWENRIEECNNVAANLEKLIGKEYALIIIDEAHLFLPAEGSTEIKKQLGALYSLTADKVVIATATPVKYSEHDLWEYAVMAHKIIHGKKENKYRGAYEKNGRQRLDAEEEDFRVAVQADQREMERVLNSYYANREEELCCCKFDVTSPVTRYFKDSISCLRADEDITKEKGIRAGARVWRYDPTGAPEEVQLAKKIRTCVSETTGGKANRMIVFFRLKEDVRRVADALQKEGFAEYTGENLPDKMKKTYAVVMGEEGQIRSYAGVEETKKEGIGVYRYFPDVLLVIYQKVEQGVNLQAYNYVLNYYIPKSSASLEQRYGRVDRIDSTYSHIYMCYWLGKNRCSEYNFYSAMFEYSNYLLASIPSRNILLSEEVLEVVKESKGKETLVKQYMHYLEVAEKNASAYLAAMNGDETFDNSEIDKEALQYLMELCEESMGLDLTEADLLVLIQEQKTALKRGKVLSAEDRERLEEIVGAGQSCGDDIFYRKEFAGRDIITTERSAKTLRSISPMRCADIIKNSENYRTYEEEFRKEVKETVVLKGFREFAGQYLLDKLAEGKLCEIFPYEDAGAYTAVNYSAREWLEPKRKWFYQHLLFRVLEERKFPENSRKDAEKERGIVANYLNGNEENAYELVKQTTFYQMIKCFERMLCEELQYQHYMHNPIYRAYARTFGEKFTSEQPAKEAFCLSVAESEGGLTVQASMFYKLVIVLLGAEKTRNLLYESENTRNRRTRCVTETETDVDGRIHRVIRANLYEVPGEQKERIWNQDAGYPVDDMLTYRIVRMHMFTEKYWIPDEIKTMRIASAEKYMDVVNRIFTRMLLQGSNYVPDCPEDGGKELYDCKNEGVTLNARMLLWRDAIYKTLQPVLTKEYGVETLEADCISTMFADVQIGYNDRGTYDGVTQTEWNYLLRNQIGVLKDIGWIRKRWREEYLIASRDGGPASLKRRERCPKGKGWNDLADGSRRVLREYCELVEREDAAITDERWKAECKIWKGASEILEWSFWKAIRAWVSLI